MSRRRAEFGATTNGDGLLERDGRLDVRDGGDPLSPGDQRVI
ncbi:hypothetical protein [Antrihabitans stalactiti]|nr:hypothetical protein [Antrihabitans stalactiti]